MNTSQPIVAVPNQQSSCEDAESSSSSVGRPSASSSNFTSHTSLLPSPTSTSVTNASSHTNNASTRPSEHAEYADHAKVDRWDSVPPSEIPQLTEIDQPSVAPAPGAKRTRSTVSPHQTPTSTPPPGKRLHRRHRSRGELHSSPPHKASRDGDSSSPLFFSHYKQERPQLPHRFSSAEAGARMLSGVMKEDKVGQKTIQLARGSMSHSSPSRPSAVRTPSGSGRNFVGLTGKSLSSSSGSPKTPGASLLSQIGLLEVCEQDDTPTFIVDLNDPTNYEPGALKYIMANSALRAVPGLLDSITGHTSTDSTSLTSNIPFSDFKAWTTSYVRDGESLDVVMPSFTYVGSSWKCITLRNRIRIFKASMSSTSVGLGSNAPSLGLPSASSISKEAKSVSGTPEAADVGTQDYFGSVPTSRPLHSRTYSSDISKSRSRKPLQKTPLKSKVDQLAPDEKDFPPIPSTPSPLTIGEHESTLKTADSMHIDQFNAEQENSPGFFDWTRMPTSPNMPPHVRFTRSVDWASTPLGPMDSWDSDLRAICNQIMVSPHPCAVYWGPEYVAIYNEPYTLIAGEKHPRLMGQCYPQAWQEIWENVKDTFRKAMYDGEGTSREEDMLFISRGAGSNLEETYFSWSIIPLIGKDGSVAGLFNPAFEKTRLKVAERRLITLHEVGKSLASAREQKSFWSDLLQSLKTNDKDVPFALLYSVTEEIDSDSQSSIYSGFGVAKQCLLEGTIGVPEGHAAAPPSIDLRNGTHYFAQVFRKAMQKENAPTYFFAKDGSLDTELLEGIDWQGFGDPCTAIVCCPVQINQGEQTLGFVVMGLNPRRPTNDNDYGIWAELLTQALSSSIASVYLFEEEIAKGRRAARAAAFQQVELSEQLKVTTKQAIEMERKFTRLFETNPVGLFIADSTGCIQNCNEKWYSIAQVSEIELRSGQWMKIIMQEDQSRFNKMWTDCVEKAVVLDTEIRFKRSWVDQNGNHAETWVLAQGFPEKDDEGNVKAIYGSVTDISQQKWAEHFEKRRMEDALETKRQQENFIDMTSHEMRNPLSALMQCAEEVASIFKALSEWQAAGGLGKVPVEDILRNLDNGAESSNVIITCAHHQLRIISDVLTLSKLDSKMLQITPASTDPELTVRRSLKMFEAEMRVKDMDMSFAVDKSYRELSVKWVNMDPSRLIQVLMNLTTNSIKFTDGNIRRISITLGASLEAVDGYGGVTFFPVREPRTDLTARCDEWGDGDHVYIHFSVSDTGRGLTDEERKLLFQRFSQANPRTHITYGGSGLGLFICRELTEQMGGKIGVSSTYGQGSTFAFYVKARRTTTVPESHERVSELAKQYSRLGPPATRPDREKLHILVVEDNLVNQKVLSRQLRNAGAIVSVANHGGECLQSLHQTSFWRAAHQAEGPINKVDVVLMDQEMPVMDGLTCTKEIRELERKGDLVGHVPVIAVTANARDEQINTAMGAGMVSHPHPPSSAGSIA